MGKNKFEEFLNKEDSEVAEINWDKKKEFFIGKVNEFYEQMDAFLAPYQDKVTVKKENYTINEDYIGSYQVEKRILHIKNNDIIFTPIGTNLIGAWGRIDMEGTNGIVKFVLVPKNNNVPKIETAILSTEEDKKKWKEKQDEISKKNNEANKIWKIATPPPNIKYINLDEETFFDALMEVING